MVKFTCPSCQKIFVDPSSIFVRSHLNDHRLYAQLHHPIACCSENCRSTAKTIEIYVKHFENVHLKLEKKLAVDVTPLIPSHPIVGINMPPEVDILEENNSLCDPKSPPSQDSRPKLSF